MKIMELSEDEFVDLCEQSTFDSHIDLGVATVSKFTDRDAIEFTVISTSAGTYGKVIA